MPTQAQAAPATAIDPTRQAAALDLQRAHRLVVRPVAPGKWAAFLPGQDGRETAPAGANHDDPVEAIEAAAAAIASGETRERERAARRLLDALGRGEHVPWPDRDAGGAVLGWDVLRTADRAVVARRPSLVAALLEVARLAAEPLAPTGGEP